MAKRIKGITIELDGETKGLDKALSGVNDRSKDLQGELRDVERLLKFSPDSTELIEQKQKLLGDQVGTTRDKLNQLKDAESEVQRQFENGDIGERQYRDFKKEIAETESKLETFEGQLESTQGKFESLADKAKATGERFKESGDKMKTAGKGLTKGVTAPILGAAAAAGVFIGKTINSADEAAKNAEKVGVSTEAYQEYQYALGQTGLSAGDSDKALGRLNTRIGEARNGSDKYSDALKNAGVDMKSLEDGTLSTDDAMMQAVEGLSKIENEQDRAAAATELFGKKLGREMMPALKDGAEGLEDTREKARDLGIILSDETAKKSEEFNDSMEDLKAGVNGAFTEFASNMIPILTDELLPALQNHLIPAVEGFADKIQDLVEWFMDLSPTMKKTIGIIILIVAAIGPLLVVFGTLASAIGSIMTLFSTLAPIFTAVGGAIGAVSLPVILTIAAIVALIAIGVLLWKNWDTVKEKAVEIWSALGEFFSDFFAKTMELFNKALNWIDEKTGGKFKSITDAIRSYLKMAKENVKAVLDFIKDTFTNALDFLKALVTGDFEGMWEAIKNQMDNIKDTISDIWGNVMDFFEDIDLKQMGKDIIQGLINGIGSMGEAVLESIGGVVDGAINWAKEKLGVKSPSRVFTEIGEYSGEGLEKGMMAMSNRVAKAGQRMADASIPEMKGNGGSQSTGSSIINNFAGLFEGANFSVRSNEDIERLAQELGEFIARKGRREGVIG